MYEKPVCTALLPDSGVADLYFDGFAILCFFRKMPRDGGPCQRATPHNFQVFAGGQTAAGHVGEEPFFNAVAIFLPAVIRERSYIVKDEAVVLGIIFGWRVGVAGAPCGAVAVDQLAECDVVGGALLSAGAHEGEESAGESQNDIQQPAPVGTLISGKLRLLHRGFLEQTASLRKIGLLECAYASPKLGIMQVIPVRYNRFRRALRALDRALTVFH